MEPQRQNHYKLNSVVQRKCFAGRGGITPAAGPVIKLTYLKAGDSGIFGNNGAKLCNAVNSCSICKGCLVAVS